MQAKFKVDENGLNIEKNKTPFTVFHSYHITLELVHLFFTVFQKRPLLTLIVFKQQLLHNFFKTFLLEVKSLKPFYLTV